MKIKRVEATLVFMPNVTKAGGLSECLRISTLVHARNLKMAPHGVGSGIGLAATLHWCAAIPNYLIYEYNQLLNPLRHDILKTKIRFEEGHLHVPTGPGLGCDLVFEELEKHPYQVSNFLPLFSPGWERRESVNPAIAAADETATPAGITVEA